MRRRIWCRSASICRLCGSAIGFANLKTSLAMNITLDIPEDLLRRLEAQADARGLTVDRWLLELAERDARLRQNMGSR